MPSPPAPPSPRVFAHVLALDLACPACGTLHPAPRGTERRAARQPATNRPGYNALTGRFVCRTCHTSFLVGVLFWRIRAADRTRRPADTVPTPEQALELRAWETRPDVEPPAWPYAGVSRVTGAESDPHTRASGRRDVNRVSPTEGAGEGPGDE